MFWSLASVSSKIECSKTPSPEFHHGLHGPCAKTCQRGTARCQGMNNPFRLDKDRSDRRSFGLGFNTASCHKERIEGTGRCSELRQTVSLFYDKFTGFWRASLRFWIIATSSIPIATLHSLRGWLDDGGTKGFVCLSGQISDGLETFGGHRSRIHQSWKQSHGIDRHRKICLELMAELLSHWWLVKFWSTWKQTSVRL